MHTYRVGELYHPDRTHWPEIAEYNYYGGAHELRLFFANISEQEVKVITRRTVEFGAVTVGSILFFLFKFADDSGWSDCPYSWHLVNKQQPELATSPSTIEENERVLLTMLLVEATTGVLRGIRACSLSINLSRYLHQAIQSQINQPFDEASYDSELQRIYATTTSDELARRAERCICQ